MAKDKDYVWVAFGAFVKLSLIIVVLLSLSIFFGLGNFFSPLFSIAGVIVILLFLFFTFASD